MKILPILLSDSYKQFHHLMYPKNMIKLYSNMTPRKSRLSTKEAVWFGMNYYLKEYLIKQWNENFFNVPIEDVVKEYKRFHKNFSFVDVTVEHIQKLHALGYLPLSIKALPEGSVVPMKVPFYTITNTDESSAWLVNFLETQMSTVLWDLTTVATVSSEYLQLLNKWAIKTTGSTDGVQWQAHDFSMRGRSSVESSLNQAGHLLSFTGTDTIPAVLMLEEYYHANIENELVGSSVPATEHSVMTSYGKESELDAFRRLLKLFPTGILSVVSDSFDLWKVCTEYIVTLKEEILARDGKLVLRPDSGDPADIICGTDTGIHGVNAWYSPVNDGSAVRKGVIELLWDVFGGTINELGFKVLDPHIGAIYGDSITLERADQICKRLEAKGFASTNIVFGIGSYTFNMQTRDSLGIAVKSTYCEVRKNDGSIEEREIFKDPITDDGTKKSAKGRLYVGRDAEGNLYLEDQVSAEREKEGELIPVFENGKLLVDPTLAEVRAKLKAEMQAKTLVA